MWYFPDIYINSIRLLYLYFPYIYIYINFMELFPWLNKPETWKKHAFGESSWKFNVNHDAQIKDHIHTWGNKIRSSFFLLFNKKIYWEECIFLRLQCTRIWYSNTRLKLIKEQSISSWWGILIQSTIITNILTIIEALIILTSNQYCLNIELNNFILYHHKLSLANVGLHQDGFMYYIKAI